MSDKFLCVLAGYDEKTENYFSGIQQKLYASGFEGRQTRDLPQHITLGTFPVAIENEISERIRRIANNTKPFEITFNHIGVFQGSQVLFIAPDTNIELLTLKEQFGDSYGWTAHTTMLIDDADQIIRALPVVLDNFSSCAGKITSLHLYEFFPTRHILSIDL